MTLEERMRRPGNNFDVLRFAAAVMVIFSHCFALAPAPTEFLYAWSGFYSFGSLGVCIFFTISGFLITKSWEDDPRLLAFARKRFFRIFPGLLSAVLFCMFVVGPLATSLPAGAYFLHEATWKYLGLAFLIPMQYTLPGVFTGNHYPDAVNGSLWTLPVEALAYAGVATLGSLGVLKTRNVPVVILLLLYFLSSNCVVRPDAPAFFAATLAVPSALIACGYFVAGMIVYHYRDKIVLSGRFCLTLLLFLLASFKTPDVHAVMMVALPYTVFYVAYGALPRLHAFSRYGDFSYGLYIYAFPIQQMASKLLRHHANWLTLFAVSIGPILALAVISWHLIERPALRLKGTRGVKREASSPGAPPAVSAAA